MQVGDLVRWITADVPVTGIIMETDVKPSPVAIMGPPIHRVIVGNLELFLFSNTLEVISENR